MQRVDLIAELSKLVSLEIDAVHAYDAAVRGVGGASGPVGAELDLFKVEHQQHALELYDLFLRLGASPPSVTPDVKGVVIGALTPPRRALSSEEILEAVRAREAASRRGQRGPDARPRGRGAPPRLGRAGDRAPGLGVGGAGGAPAVACAPPAPPPRGPVRALRRVTIFGRGDWP
jgi:hypothetical protein